MINFVLQKKKITIFFSVNMTFKSSRYNWRTRAATLLCKANAAHFASSSFRRKHSDSVTETALLLISLCTTFQTEYKYRGYCNAGHFTFHTWSSSSK